MNDEPLMEAVVQAVLFLELSDAQTVDEDAAVALMEQIAATLQRLDPVARQRFIQYTCFLAARANSDQERMALENVAIHLGLISE